MNHPWRVLCLQLDEESICTLFPLYNPLKIALDKFYMIVIENLIKKVFIYLFIK